METLSKISENNLQSQIDSINYKLDLLLEETRVQRLKREEMDDLVGDLSIIGKDIFKTTVVELDNAGVELDTEVLAGLGMKFLRNIKTFYELFEFLESANDFVKDAGPIAQDVGLNLIRQLNEYEQKGYFEFMREGGKIIENIVTTYPPEDVRLLADNIVSILDTLKNMTQPDMLKALNNAVSVFHHIETEDIEEYSFWRAFKELRTPEFKRGIGFFMTFMKNLAEKKG